MAEAPPTDAGCETENALLSPSASPAAFLNAKPLQEQPGNQTRQPSHGV